MESKEDRCCVVLVEQNLCGILSIALFKQCFGEDESIVYHATLYDEEPRSFDGLLDILNKTSRVYVVTSGHICINFLKKLEQCTNVEVFVEGVVCMEQIKQSGLGCDIFFKKSNSGARSVLARLLPYFLGKFNYGLLVNVVSILQHYEDFKLQNDRSTDIDYFYKGLVMFIHTRNNHEFPIDKYPNVSEILASGARLCDSQKRLFESSLKTLFLAKIPFEYNHDTKQVNYNPTVLNSVVVVFVLKDGIKLPQVYLPSNSCVEETVGSDPIHNDLLGPLPRCAVTVAMKMLDVSHPDSLPVRIVIERNCGLHKNHIGITVASTTEVNSSAIAESYGSKTRTYLNSFLITEEIFFKDFGSYNK